MVAVEARWFARVGKECVCSIPLVASGRNSINIITPVGARWQCELTYPTPRAP